MNATDIRAATQKALSLHLASQEVECAECKGTGKDCWLTNSYGVACGPSPCNGTGKVPRWPELRMVCPDCGDLCDPGDCIHESCQCQGRGWVPAVSLEVLLVAVEEMLPYVSGSYSEPGTWRASVDSIEDDEVLSEAKGDTPLLALSRVVALATL